MSKIRIFLQERILGRQDRLIFPTWLACQNTELTSTFSVGFFKLIFLLTASSNQSMYYHQQ